MAYSRNPIRVARNLLATLTGATLIAASLSFAGIAHAAPDNILQPLQPWNGKKVYLSPARHSPDNIGCQDFKESRNAVFTAWRAAATSYLGSRISTSQYRNLRARGYLVRIGRGTLSSAIANSNAWAADIHIPIHSNARGTGADCSKTAVDYGGTLVIFKSYGDKGGEGLAGLLRDKFGPASPGTRDSICHNSEPCTRFNCLGELCQTIAKAAYLEREYHTWNTGVNFMKKEYHDTWRIGWAVDKFLGYPRARNIPR